MIVNILIQICFGIIIMATIYKSYLVANRAFDKASDGENFDKEIKKYFFLNMLMGIEFTVAFVITGYYSLNNFKDLLLIYALGIFSTYMVRRHAVKSFKKSIGQKSKN